MSGPQSGFRVLKKQQDEAMTPLDGPVTINAISLDTKATRKQYDADLQAIAKLRRLTDYLSAAQLYLLDNFTLEKPLDKNDIKQRLLGHWGTCPGLNMCYAHASHMLRRYQDVEAIFVTGPGHGAPAVLANLWVEGAMQKYYSEYSLDKIGMRRLIKMFSWEGGFPSHVNAQTPGAIHEGGELGYALAVSFGAVMDNPDLIAVCVVGDGECETASTATGWHSYKFIDPRESGAVLPIIHLNGYKISERTIYGTMREEELLELFTGYGYQVRFVQDLEDIDADLMASFDWAVGEIKKIQRAARSGEAIFQPRWPLLILQTPKGWGCPFEVNGDQIEGTYRSHGIPLKNVRKDEAEFRALKTWLERYKVQELLDENGAPLKEILHVFPPTEVRRLGLNPKTNPQFVPIDLPDLKPFAIDSSKQADVESSIMEPVSFYLGEVCKRNPHTFRIFSPDEFESNKLDKGVFKYTHRNMQWSREHWNKGGRVIEVLSENQCQGFMQGYTLTGRVALFPSYETFLGIVTTMMIQYCKFVKIAAETNWHRSVPSINYIETSTLWRQEHNGFSHQNPSFINALLNMKSKFVRVYLPPDANCFLVTLDHCLNSKNYVNLLVGTKNPIPSWLTLEEATVHCVAGAGVWKFCSTDDGVEPDVVLVGCGNEVNNEVVAAALLLRRDCPALRVRMVNVTDLMILDMNRNHPHALDTDSFHALFTADRPVIFNFHGYPTVISELLFGRQLGARWTTNGYIEEGTTTTPFNMLMQNRVSRFHVAMQALKQGSRVNPRVTPYVSTLLGDYAHQIRMHQKYIELNNADPDHLLKVYPPSREQIEDQARLEKKHAAETSKAEAALISGGAGKMRLHAGGLQSH